MAKRKSKRTIRLEVSWDFSEKLNDPDIDFEHRLEKIAKTCGGREVGSGAGFGKRDVSYDNFSCLADVALAKGHLVSTIKQSGRKGIGTSIIIETEEK